MTQVVVLIGSGATRAQVRAKTAQLHKPPLDKGFFTPVRSGANNSPQLSTVQGYLKQYYGYADIHRSEINSFESVASILYSDAHSSRTQANAYPAFLDLLQLLSKRIADTTNQINMQGHNLLAKFLSYLVSRYGADNVSIITFNYDLQIERALLHIQSRRTATTRGLFKFPGCYRLPSHTIRRVFGTNVLVSERDLDDAHDGVPILKLHGSLNWYSGYNSKVPSQRQFFRGDRAFRIANVASLPNWPIGVRTPARRNFYGYPILVPPVPHKSSLFHDQVRDLWLSASSTLAAAEDLYIFGYSCPPSDQEAANLIRSTAGINSSMVRLTIIDPDTNVIRRFASLTEARSIDWYRYIGDFLRKN